MYSARRAKIFENFLYAKKLFKKNTGELRSGIEARVLFQPWLLPDSAYNFSTRIDLWDGTDLYEWDTFFEIKSDLVSRYELGRTRSVNTSREYHRKSVSIAACMGIPTCLPHAERGLFTWMMVARQCYKRFPWQLCCARYKSHCIFSQWVGVRIS